MAICGTVSLIMPVERIAERVTVVRGDITTQRVDVIVNASNPSLLPGTGCCAAIHRAAGHRLAFECAKLGGCKTGEAKITPGLRLYAKHVIHTVGPVWNGGKDGEPEMLATCYVNCLKLAADSYLRTIAFPAISTGIYGYPVEQASRIAAQTVADYLKADPRIEHVIFVCFTEYDEEVYLEALAHLFPGQFAMTAEQTA